MRIIIVMLTIVGLFSSPIFGNEQLTHESERKSQSITYQSNQEPALLLELYTSEGCHSCPPADRWFTATKQSTALWNKFVPVVFHVDYWDYIGWPDRFASAEYSQRQRRYAREFQESTVYTPGVRLAGYEWRDWRYQNHVPSLEEVGEDGGNLDLNISESGELSASFKPIQDGSRQSRQLTIAVLGMNLETEVERGENSGKTLAHDFVVLGMTTVSASEKSGGFTWKGQLPDISQRAPSYSVAAWVTEGGSLKPIQAVGGNLPESFVVN